MFKDQMKNEPNNTLLFSYEVVFKTTHTLMTTKQRHQYDHYI